MHKEKLIALQSDMLAWTRLNCTAILRQAYEFSKQFVITVICVTDFTFFWDEPGKDVLGDLPGARSPL